MDSIRIENLTYRYATAKADSLKGVNLSIREGEFCSIVGPNGGGKTTLCNAIRGFVPKFYKGELEGNVWIEGKNVEEYELGDLAMKVGFVFQNPFTQISGIAKTVYEELAYGLENMGIEPGQIRKRVEDVMKLAKIEEFRDRNPYQLSGGQQQRIALAAILIMQQDILVIDEPTSQLDPQSTDDIFALIREMKNRGKTIVLVEHKMEQVAEYSDHLVIMEGGRIAAEGTPHEVIGSGACERLHTRVPQCTKIGTKLREQGIALRRVPITMGELLEDVREYKQEKRAEKKERE